MKTHLRNIVFWLFFSIFSVSGLVGCDKDGPMENAGEELDEAGKDAKRAIEDATD